jgi:hypothetical protein
MQERVMVMEEKQKAWKYVDVEKKYKQVEKAVEK